MSSEYSQSDWEQILANSRTDELRQTLNNLLDFDDSNEEEEEEKNDQIDTEREIPSKFDEEEEELQQFLEDEDEYEDNSEIEESVNDMETVHSQSKKSTKSYNIWILVLSVIFTTLGIVFYYRDYMNRRFSSYSCPQSPARPIIQQKFTISKYLLSISTDLQSILEYTQPIGKIVGFTHLKVQSILESFTTKKTNSPKFPEKRIRTFSIDLNNSAKSNVHMINASNIDIKTMINQVIESRIPTVITDSVEINSWKALKWNYSTWNHYFGYLDQVLMISSMSEDVEEPFVFLASNNDAEGEVYSHISPSKGIENFKFQTFLDGIKTFENNSEPKYFFNGNYRIIESIAQLREDTTWKSLRYIEEQAIANNLTVNQTDSYLTLMYPNTALQARISEYHTMRIQLSGMGKYVIFKPEYSKRLYPFPSVHSAASQAQVDLYNQNIRNKLFPSSNKASYQVTTLSPGQVLYIPPFHYVHTEATVMNENSKSKSSNQFLHAHLDVFSPSLEQLILLEAGFVQAMFGDLNQTEEKIIVAQIYVIHILSRVQGIKTPKKYARSLFATRYTPLFGGIDSLVLRKLELDFNCFSDQPDITNQVLKKISKEHVVSLAELVSEALNDPFIHSSTRLYWLGNYIEHIAVWAMENSNYGKGKVEKAALFLRQCLNFNSKLEIVVEVEGPSVLKIN